MGFFDSLFGKKKEDATVKRICPVCGMEFSAAVTNKNGVLDGIRRAKVK